MFTDYQMFTGTDLSTISCGYSENRNPEGTPRFLVLVCNGLIESSRLSIIALTADELLKIHGRFLNVFLDKS